MIPKTPMTNSNSQVLGASFRDPCGFVFMHQEQLYRQINLKGEEDFKAFIDSGLYNSLLEKGYIVAHEEADLSLSPAPELAQRIIKPSMVPFISYPYEWSFSQYQTAALLTIRLQKMAFEHGMELKDATAYNIQWVNNKPVFIDTLSFSKFEEGSPWVAYKQFCQHFLAPLFLMSKVDIGLSKLMRVYIDGIPLELASSALKGKTKMSLAANMHIHTHAKLQNKHADSQGSAKIEGKKIGKQAMLGLLDNLRSAIKKLNYSAVDTEWGDYYDNTNYNDSSFQLKKDFINGILEKTKPAMVWDMGENTGEFSRLASSKRIETVAFDIDPAAVEKNYLICKKEQHENITPLVMDLTNPSPGLGWHNSERDSMLQRGPCDLGFALAIIHHLSISNNLPFRKTAAFFADAANSLIIEFVPKSDSQVKILLATREDIFPSYNEEGFEKAYAEFFDILDSKKIDGSERTIYYMKRKETT